MPTSRIGVIPIQDAEGRALLFESTIDLGVARNDRVRLWLLGSTVKEVAEGTFTYKVFTGIAAEHIMQKEAGSPVQPREVYIRDLTDEMLSRWSGCATWRSRCLTAILSAYDEYYVSGGGVNVYGKNLTKYYGTCLRDINGDHLYMLTNFGVDYRRHSLPMGSGNRHGHPDPRVQLNFGEMGAFQIRHLTQAEIAPRPFAREQLQQGARRVDLCQTAGFKEGVTHVAPTTGPASASLYKRQCRRFLQRLPRRQRPRLFRQQAARRRLERSGGTANTVKGGGMYSARCGIRTPTGLSATSRPRESVRSCRCRSETNSLLATGPRDFVVEYSDRRYVVDGRSGRQLYRHRPVRLEKCAASLHARLQGLRLRPCPPLCRTSASVSIRLRWPASTGTDGKSSVVPNATNRLGHVSIKYNK